MKIKPIGDRVLVKMVEIEEKTKGGILLPDTATKEKSMIGDVVEVGNGEKVKEINVGEKVIYEKYSGTEVKDGEEKYLLLNVDNILAKVEL
ncbi:MAG: co-chaperone GroES [Fusobacteria bacterium]|nr:co-chaperone GroES [Fusobacteriota bacterium]